MLGLKLNHVSKRGHCNVHAQWWLSSESPHEGLTLKQLETPECALSPVVTDALVLKHQVISIHSAD